MKKHLLITILLASTLWSARALDWTYSTNLFYALDYPTNIYMGTNPADGAVNGDTFYVWGTKINAFMNLSQRRFLAGGGTNSPTVAVTNVVPLPPYAQPTVTNLGNNTVAVFQFGIPAVPTNVVLSSQLLTAYQTNNIVWGTSNYIGTVPGFYSIEFNGGALGPGGLAVMTNVNQTVYASTNSGGSWFVVADNNLTNAYTFTTTNPVQLAVSGAGGGLGYLQVWYVDYPTAMGRTNGHYGQIDLFDDPKQAQQPATKNYVDINIANALNGQLSTTSSNRVNYTTFTSSGVQMWQAATYLQTIPIAYARSGTNVLISTPQTNLISGWQMTSTTNLSLRYSFTTFTNYVLSTNTGIVTFTVPIKPGEMMRFYQLQGSSSATFTFSVSPKTPGIAFTTNTITSSTNSTYGYGGGLLMADTNYLYVSIATNTWRRIAIPTNTW